MGGLYSHTYRATGTVLTQGIYNGDHQNHIDNETPQMMDDYSSSAAQMQSTADPYPGSVESLASSLAGEVERLRYVIKQITGEDQWYKDPTRSLNDGIINVTDAPYNATGDGVTDDTAAIQAALTAATAGLVFPSGTYSVTVALSKTLTAGQHLTIRAIGAVTIASTMSEPGSEAGILSFTGTATSHVTIDGITITHTGIATVGNVSGIYIYNASPAANTFGSVTMRNVKATGCSLAGFRLNGLSSFALLDCTADDNNYAGCILSGCQHGRVTGGSYSTNGISGGTGDYGITCAPDIGYGTNSDITISDVTANDNFRKGIDVHSGEHIAIRNNHITFAINGSGSTPAGIYAANEGTTKVVKDVIIDGNEIDCAGATGAMNAIDVGAAGASATASGPFIITNNVVRNVNANASNIAILLRNPSAGGVAVDRIVVANNIVENGTGNGVTRAIIYGSNSGVAPKAVVVANNILHSEAASYGGIVILEGENTTVTGNIVSIDGGTSSYGIYVAAADTGLIIGNHLTGGATYTTAVYGPTAVIARNVYGIGSLEENEGAAASVANGGTITHGIGVAPTVVQLTASIAGEFATVTSISSTTITVAIKKHDNSAGTTQTIYWYAKR